MDDYSRRSEAALTFHGQGRVSWRGTRSRSGGEARSVSWPSCNPRGLPNVNDGPLALTPSNVDQVKIAAAAERAVADELRVENDEAYRPRSGRAIALVRSEPAA